MNETNLSKKKNNYLVNIVQLNYFELVHTLNKLSEIWFDMYCVFGNRCTRILLCRTCAIIMYNNYFMNLLLKYAIIIMGDIKTYNLLLNNLKNSLFFITTLTSCSN